MTFDTITLVLVGAIVLGIALILFGLLVSRRQRLGRNGDRGTEPYAASRERPYLKPAAPPATEGKGVTDEVAHAATDVAAPVLGVKVKHCADGPADDLEMLKGVGPKFAARLIELGLCRFEQLAGLNANEVAHLDERLGPFQGRLQRDRIIEQADLLARGDTESFEERFGKLGG